MSTPSLLKHAIDQAETPVVPPANREPCSLSIRKTGEATFWPHVRGVRAVAPIRAAS